MSRRTHFRHTPWLTRVSLVSCWLLNLGILALMLSFMPPPWGPIATLTTLFAMTVFVVRASRIGLVINDNAVIIRNQFRTHVVPWLEIKRICSSTGSKGGAESRLSIQRKNGAVISISGVSAGARRDRLVGELKDGARQHNIESQISRKHLQQSDSILRVIVEGRLRSDDRGAQAEARELVRFRLLGGLPLAALVAWNVGVLPAVLVFLLILGLIAGASRWPRKKSR
jgi:hypothetical protein